MSNKARAEFEEWFESTGIHHMFSEAFYEPWLAAKDKYEAKWRSVEHEIPAEGAGVNFICDDSVFVGRYNDGFFTEDGWELLSVKHWAPLPTAPSAKGDVQ